MMRARKRDANERDIIIALRARGATVEQLDGYGVPDLLVAFRGRLYLLEVKEPSRVDGKAHKRSDSKYPELTPAQVRWWSAWSDHFHCRPTIVHNPDEARCAVGLHTFISADPACVFCGANA